MQELSSAIESPDGTKFWYLNGQRHRVGGPAVERPDRYKAWCLNGQWHRVDGPAIEWPDGTKEWYLNGKRHRVDGPAVERPDVAGGQKWYLNGTECPKKMHRTLTQGPVKDLPLYLRQGFDEFIGQRLK